MSNPTPSRFYGGAYDTIRPFEPDELPAVYDRLLADPQFCKVVAALFPQLPAEVLAGQMRACKTSLDFQKTFCYTFLKDLLAKASTGCDMDSSALSTRRRYTFVSNHRDIVLDSALLDVMLIDARFPTTCEIAIGDNLLSLPWVKDLVRVNKSFIVERSLPPREMLMASRRLSEYMHLAIGQKNENIWIAQREGRAKDSDDRTQPAILKMMAMGGEGTPVERLRALHIVPLSISYEYDPCDFLKAREMQQRRDNAHWHKAPGEDVNSMRTGIMGYKGRIHYHAAPCIDEWLARLPEATPKTQLFDLVAAHIDRQIHSHYRLYPANYAALDLLNGTADFAGHYTPEERAAFEGYLDRQLAKIDLPQPDGPFLRRQLLTMYATPLRNHLVATSN